MSKNYFSIDIGGTNIKTALLDHSGNILVRKKFTTPQNYQAFIRLIETEISLVSDDIHGVAISCPGKVDTETGTIYFGGALPFLDGVSLRKELEQRFNCPVAVINDGKAAALAELWLGNLKEVQNGVAITLGTGLGGGIIVNGQLVQGNNYQSGELSFMLKPSDKLKTEDLYGFSGSAVQLIQTTSEILKFENRTDGVAVFEAIKHQDKKVYPIFQTFCREIAYVIINLQAVLDLQRVVIGGGISAQAIVISEIERQYLAIRKEIPLMEDTLAPVSILACHYRNDANLLGALYQLLLQIDNELP